jgi:hypothetical protein
MQMWLGACGEISWDSRPLWGPLGIVEMGGSELSLSPSFR